MDSNPAKRRKLEHQPPHQDEPSSTGTARALDAAATAGTSRPSAFVLQTQELLREVRVNYDNSFVGADDLLRQIKYTIEAIHPQGPTAIHQASSALEKKHRIIVPFPDPKPPKDCPYKVAFFQPAQVNVVGSYVAKTMVKSQPLRVIDMIVEMPKDLFQDKDYLNLRYFYKRAYYLAVLSAALQSEFSSTATFTYEYADGNCLLPVLILFPEPASKDVGANPKKSHKAAYQIRIIPCAPEGLFPVNKLLPTSCCIRSASDDQSPTTSQVPTPFYNSALKAESCYIPYLKVIRQAEKTCPAFRDACILGRVWLQQRGLAASISKGGFGPFEWAFLTALLLQGGGRKGMAALSPSLSSTQIFKALIQYLAAADLTKKPLIFGSPKHGVQAAKEQGPVIFDAIRQLNVAYKMSVWSASLLQQHAKWTHTCMADQEADQFNPTFIIKADSPLQCFDLLVRVEKVPGAHMLDYRGHLWGYCDKVARILNRALGDRVQLVNLEPSSNANSIETLKSLPPSTGSSVLVGIIFNAANMARQVDHGPTVEEKEAAKAFRQFWGDKSELRRFKDGRILESLIWTQTSPLALCEEIIRYILKLHLRLDDEHLQFLGKGFSAVVPIKSLDSNSFHAATQAFRTFEQDLRDLTDLPLQIRSVAATGPELRHASVRPPAFDFARASGQAMDTAIYFEASGKWPENLAAIQRTKIAFLLKIGESLSRSKPGMVCQVGLEEAQTEIENLAFLDVTYEEGAVFRLRIHSDLEQSLLERRAREKTLDQRVRTEGAQLLASFKRLYTILPLHTQMIATCCGRFPALSPTIRLVKHWFDSHKLSYHFLEEMIELLALRTFLEPYPWQAPSSGMTGFLRTLQFLASWDWRVEPLILDTSEELVGSERSAIETRLEAWRKIDPSMIHTTLFIATSHDTSGTAYTIHGGRPYPSKVVATRMTTLARSACKWVKDNGITLEPKTLFQPSLKEYDFLIHLKSKALKAISRGDVAGKQSQFKNLDGRTGQVPQPIVQAAPRVLLQQFEGLFSGPLLLFHGATDDATIGVGKEQDEDGEDLLEVNMEGIIAEMARIGGDCIEKIELMKRL